MGKISRSFTYTSVSEKNILGLHYSPYWGRNKKLSFFFKCIFLKGSHAIAPHKHTHLSRYLRREFRVGSITILDRNCVDVCPPSAVSLTRCPCLPPTAALNANPPHGSFANHMYVFYKGIFEYMGQMDLVILTVTQRRDERHIFRLSVMTPSSSYSKVRRKA